jgi:glycosyltransferase involved in cell wall biosynthesis
VLIEALAAGVPIIASDVGGVPEIIQDNINGLLIPPANPSSLAKACLQLLESNKQLSEIVSAGNIMVKEQFDVNSQIKKLGRIYQEAHSAYAKRQ